MESRSWGRTDAGKVLISFHASRDSTIQIWDVDASRVVKKLTCPTVEEGRIVKTYGGGRGTVYEVCWNVGGDRIAAAYSGVHESGAASSFSGNVVSVADFRM
ncbi:hypothetical protein M569_09895 [Genlisea aurea]|uniref:Uncharacterized protein n=1 Tax=Genlisea aurea TaxID=192259 RepID=S8CDG6_9LAMI|nr:hypothetical protein M569_09895 [Genlisea aurea]